MNTDNGALEFDAYFNNERLNQTASEAEKRVKGFSVSTIKAGESIERSLSGITGTIALIGGTTALTMLGKNILDTTAKFEKFGIVLRNTLGDIKGDQALDMISNFAATTPFQLDEVTSAFIKMANQGFVPTRAEMVKLGDLASSTGKSFDQLGEALLDAQTGQFERLKEFGIKASANGDKVTFSFKEQKTTVENTNSAIQKYILSLGELNGVAGANEKISASLTGQMSNLEDKFAAMYNDIGKSNSGLLYSAVGLSSELVENYKEIINVLIPIVATYGAYKAAILATVAAQRAAAAATFIQEYLAMGRAVGFATANQIAFNRAVLANPYALAAAAVAGLSVVIYRLSSNLSETESAHKRLNDAMEAGNVKINEEKSKVASLISVINDENNSREYRNDKIKELIKLSPENLSNLTLENIKTNEGKTAIDEYIKSLEKKIKMQTLEAELEESIKRMQTAESGNENLSFFDKALAMGLSGGNAALLSSRLALKSLKNNTEVISAEKELQETIKSQISDIVGEDSGKKTADVVINAEYWEKQVKNAKEAIDKLDTKSKGYASEHKKLIDIIKKGEAELDKIQSYKGSDKENEKQQNSKLEKYEKSLKKELDLATSVMQKMEIINRFRKEIAGDKSALGKGKTSILNELEYDVSKETRDRTNKLVEDYSSSLDRKKKLFQDYANDIILLQKKLDEATNPDEKASISGAITNRAIKYSKDSKTSGDSEYDSLLDSYKNFEQKKQSIIDEYDEKRRKAQEFGNTELVKQLNKSQAKEISDLSMSELQDSPAFKELFSNLDNLTIKKMAELRDKIETDWSKLNLSPEALKALRDQINQVEEKIRTKNPFKALSEAIEKYKNDQSSVNIKDVFKGISASADLVKGSFDAVVGSLDKMGVKTDEGTNQVLNDVSGMLGGASDLAMGIATGNPLQIIQGSITLISNGIDLIAGAKDRKLQRSIEQHQKSVEKLKTSYEDLERAIDGALGSDRYSSQKATIENLKKQQVEYAAMAQAERDKKKTDDAKIKEYNDAIKSNSNAISDAVNAMREDILTMDVSSAASELGNAIIDAFAAGEDAATAWGSKVDDIVGNVIRKMLIQKLVEEPVGNIINKYMSQWVDSDGNFLGFDAVMSSAQTMGNDLKGLGSGLSAALESLPDEIKKYFTGDSGAGNALAGSIKGASEESISILSGYANAIRINQIETLSVIRTQLLALNQIAGNTSHNVKLNDILAVLQSMKSSDSLRSQGLG